jgi:hypothetical protein
VIDPAYLSDPDVADLLLDGMELIREAMASKLIAAGISLELSPGTGYPDGSALAKDVGHAEHHGRQHQRSAMMIGEQAAALLLAG